MAGSEDWRFQKAKELGLVDTGPVSTGKDGRSASPPSASAPPSTSPKSTSTPQTPPDPPPSDSSSTASTAPDSSPVPDASTSLPLKSPPASDHGSTVGPASQAPLASPSQSGPTQTQSLQNQPSQNQLSQTQSSQNQASQFQPSLPPAWSLPPVSSSSAARSTSSAPVADPKQADGRVVASGLAAAKSAPTSSGPVPGARPSNPMPFGTTSRLAPGPGPRSRSAAPQFGMPSAMLLAACAVGLILAAAAGWLLRGLIERPDAMMAMATASRLAVPPAAPNLASLPETAGAPAGPAVALRPAKPRATKVPAEVKTVRKLPVVRVASADERTAKPPKAKKVSSDGDRSARSEAAVGKGKRATDLKRASASRVQRAAKPGSDRAMVVKLAVRGRPGDSRPRSNQSVSKALTKAQGSARSGTTASINCRRARTDVSRMICGDTRLGALDKQMASAYRAAVRRGGARSEKGLDRKQASFLNARERCETQRCVAQITRLRLYDLAHP